MAAFGIFVLVTCAIAFVQGLPGGPPLTSEGLRTSVCVDLVPASSSPHVLQSGQNGYDINTDLPFNMTVNMYQYTGGSTYQVTIRGNNFRGFLVQARDPSDTAIGAFTTLATTQQLLTDCSQAGVSASATIAHMNPNLTDFPYQTFNWTAPSGGDGYVRIVYTIVPMRTQYFGPLLSPPVLPSQIPTTPPLDLPIIRRFPENCDPTECDIFVGVAINAENNNYLDFHIVGSAQAWVAAGFSATQNMLAADVVTCTVDPTTNMVTAQDTYNAASGRNNVLDTIQNTVLLFGSFDNDRIKCIVAKTIIGSDVPNQDINLNTDNLYLLYARGDTGVPAQIGGHATGPTNRAATDGPINPAAVAAAALPTTTAPPPSAGAVRTTGMTFSLVLAVLVSGITVFLKF